ncbi:MAG: 50S ribosomal protein L4 [Patescibacteria group bacterium]|jgi:large subunit ribosomal protein L4
MITIPFYNNTGEKIGEQKLSKNVFGVTVKPIVLQQVVVAQQANSRVAIAHTKNKSEVRGGGKKPWKQKGTGQARAGSSRSPLWRGGGVIFGPRSERNFTLKINKKVKKQALRMVLSDKATNEKIIVIDQFSEQINKTKQIQQLVSKLSITGKTKLLVLGQAVLATLKAARNLSKTSLLAANSLNVVDLLKYEYIIMDQAALAIIERLYSIKKEAKPEIK